MSLIAATLSKTIFLVVAACSPTECTEAVNAEAWYGVAAMNECRAFVADQTWDPSDYLTLGGDQDHYEISCSQ